VQSDKPAPPAPPSASEAGKGGASDGANPSPARTEGLSRAWRLVAFLWITSFVFLWLFELLSALFQALS
jgi:hypothetical protein